MFEHPVWTGVRYGGSLSPSPTERKLFKYRVGGGAKKRSYSDTRYPYLQRPMIRPACWKQCRIYPVSRYVDDMQIFRWMMWTKADTWLCQWGKGPNEHTESKASTICGHSDFMHFFCGGKKRDHWRGRRKKATERASKKAFVFVVGRSTKKEGHGPSDLRRQWENCMWCSMTSITLVSMDHVRASYKSVVEHLS